MLCNYTPTVQAITTYVAIIKQEFNTRAYRTELLTVKYSNELFRLGRLVWTLILYPYSKYTVWNDGVK